MYQALYGRRVGGQSGPRGSRSVPRLRAAAHTWRAVLSLGRLLAAGDSSSGAWLPVLHWRTGSYRLAAAGLALVVLDAAFIRSLACRSMSLVKSCWE